MAKKDALAEPEAKLGFTIEEAAAAFAEHLPQAIQDFLNDMEIQEGTPKHVYLLSYVMRHHELGELSYRVSENGLPEDYGVKNFTAPTNKVPAKPIEAQCEWCSKPFVPERLGQKYCPDNPDATEPSCGLMASIDERRKAREAKGDFRDSRASAEHQARAKALVVARTSR